MTKLTENNPQGTANIADDRVLANGLYCRKCKHNQSWQYEKLALQSLSIYHSSLIANFLYCVLSAALLSELILTIK